MHAMQRKHEACCQPQKNAMRKLLVLIPIALVLLASCTKDGAMGGGMDSSPDAFSGSSGGGNGNGNGGGTGGVMTAGEWNDLAQWDFWKTLMQRDTIKLYPGKWGFYLSNRVTVTLKDQSGKLIHDARIKLVYNGKSVTGVTSNDGRAELFPSVYEPNYTLDNFSLSAEYAGQHYDLGSWPASQTSITKTIPVNKIVSNNLDIMFVVDATGSMGDEIRYLKDELLDVINRAGNQLPGVSIRMSSVFYRDHGDDYLTRPFNFTTNPSQLVSFINNQSAGGGNDFPEAVDEALKTGMEQSWSDQARNRLLFLILDAPPHDEQAVMGRLKTAVSQAMEKGIRIIPISASGIDWETEFLLRFLSISTNSTYVFITDHSGIGNSHHTPTVGSYQVEYLNNLMVRLITKYGQNMD